MSTRSFISEKTESGYRGVYCHFDGYPSGVGAVLNSSYNTPEKVTELIDQGGISYLEETLDESRFYHKWRNEPKNIRNAASKEDLKFIADSCCCDYLYVFENGEWTHQRLY